MTDGSATERIPHVILVGLPGAGKTSVGREVARALGRAFLDFDEEIERREQRSVARIFSESGESYFRVLETQLTRQLAERNGMILAPGGGWAADPARVALLRPPARMIYLRVSPKTALARLESAGSVADRPLLTGGTGSPLERRQALAKLRELSAAREPWYWSADSVIDTEVLDVHEVAREVRRLVAT